MTHPTAPAPLTRQMTLLVSRISARGRAERQGREALRILRAAGWDVTVQLTDLSDIPADLAEAAGGPLVGAVGGDGYLSAVARGVVNGGGGILVPFPAGSGNDLCRTLGLGVDPVARARSLAEANEAELAQRVQRLDGMWVQTADRDERQLALGVVSLGIDATANLVANRSWIRHGPLSYTWGGLHAFFSHRRGLVNGTVDGREHDFSGWIASVSNTGRIGGGIQLVPSSDPSDGMLEVFNVGNISRWRALPLLARVLSRRAPDSPLVKLFRGVGVTIEADPSLPVMADGDLLGHTPVRVDVAPRLVRVLV